jgi:hypothetical protein
MNRILRLLLVAYPRNARLRYGTEIVATVLDRLKSTPRRRGLLLAREASGLVLAGIDRSPRS